MEMRYPEYQKLDLPGLANEVQQRWDENNTFPRDTLNRAAELGFGAIYVSQAQGGIGLTRVDAALIMEALAFVAIIFVAWNLPAKATKLNTQEL